MGLEGRPNVKSGIKAPELAALLADSGPATPSITPVPNFSGRFDTFFSKAYERNVAMIPPPPGNIPKKNPKKDPRIIGPVESFQSFKLGSKPLIFVLKISM